MFSLPPPQLILKVVELGRRGYTLREIASILGVSYSYLRKRLSELRKRGYDIPRFPRGRRKKLVNENKFHKIFSKSKMLPRVKNCVMENEKSTVVRLKRDELIIHIIKIVVSEGYVSTSEIKRRLKVWGYKFSDSTFWRAVKYLELFNLIEVERQRGPRGNFLRPSKRLVFLALRRSDGHGLVAGGNIFVSVTRYVENYVRRWEFGLEFKGVSLSHIRWMQVYGRKGWIRFEFHPRKGQDVEYVRALRDLVRLAVLVSVSLGVSYADLVRVLAEEWVLLGGGRVG